MKKILLLLLVLTSLTLTTTFAPAQNLPDDGYSLSTQAKKVKSIEVRGNKSISIAQVLSKIKTRVGQDYRQSIISDDLKRLYNTGYFSDVSIDREDFEGGLKVFIDVEEKPIVEEITFSKTRYVKSKVILSKIKTKVGKFLDNKSLNDDVNTIEEMYAKKGLTRAEVDVESFIDETTNKASLHFVIREGFRVKIKRINILGNTAYSDGRLIKVMKSRPAWLFNSGFLKENVVEEDMTRLEEYYEKNGYIHARAGYTIEELGRGRVNVNVTVEEGKRYHVGRVTYLGNEVLSSAEINKAIENIETGKIFSRAKMAEDMARVRSLYFDKGYIFAQVDESTALNPDTGSIDVSVDIEEGSIAYINKVKIQGNANTRDIVIRRELRMFPGDQFDGVKLRRSKERLANLGYFEDVSYDIEDTNIDDQKNLVVQVKEAKTGSFSFGGGYSSVDELVGFIEVEQRNFDFANWPNFTGGGQHLSLRAEAGSTRNNLKLSFTEPWLFDYPISAGFDLYHLNRDRERDIGYAYDEERSGLNLRFGKEIAEYTRANMNYRIEEIDISNLDSNVSSALLDEAGNNVVSSIGFGVTRDKRDSSINPTKGWILSGSTDLAGGPLQGDKDFYRLETRGSYYIPLKWGSVLEFRGRVGMVQDYGDSNSVPIFERYFAGGARSIRGFDERKVGPLDPATNDPIGGETIFVGNVEYTIPVVEFIKLAAFVDTGNVWATTSEFGDDELKSGTGLGLRIKTPIGPVSLDYGYPLSDEPGEESKSGKFYFSVSRGF